MGQPRDAARLADEVVRRLERSQPDRKDTDLAATLWHAYDLHARVTTELYPPQVYTLVMGDCREMLALARGSLHHWPDAEARTLYRIAYISMLVGSGDHLRRAWEAVQRSETLARERITRLHALRVKAGILRRVGAEHTSQLQQIVRTVDREAGAADPLTAALVKQGIGLNLIVVSQRERPDSVRLIEEAEAAYEAAYRTGREDRHTWSLIQRTRAVLAALPGVDHDLETAQIYAEEGLDVARVAGWRRTAGQCSLVLKAVAQRKALDTVPV
jgi:hypothetical protein